MEYLSYSEEKKDVNINVTYSVLIDSNNLIYVNNGESIHVFNIIDKSHKYFYCKGINNLTDILLLDNSTFPKIIACSEDGEIVQYNLYEKKVAYKILFNDKNIYFLNILKINQKKILLFTNDYDVYIFNIANKQIEIKLNFSKNLYPFLSMVKSDHKLLNFMEFETDVIIDEPQLSILKKLKIFISKNEDERIFIKKIEVKNKTDNYPGSITDFIINKYNIEKNCLKIEEKSFKFWPFDGDVHWVNEYCFSLINNKFIFRISVRTFPPFEYIYNYLAIYNLKTQKYKFYQLSEESCNYEDAIYYNEEYDFLSVYEDKIYLFKFNGDYKIIDEEMFK